MKCKVLLNNDAVTVIDYDGSKVQIPSIKCDKSVVNVIHDNGKFTVVPDDFVDVVPDQTEEKPKNRKKTTKKPKETESCIVF